MNVAPVVLICDKSGEFVQGHHGSIPPHWVGLLAFHLPSLSWHSLLPHLLSLRMGLPNAATRGTLKLFQWPTGNDYGMSRITDAMYPLSIDSSRSVHLHERGMP